MYGLNVPRTYRSKTSGTDNWRALVDAHDQIQKAQGLELLVGLFCVADGACHIVMDSSAINDGLPRLGSDWDLSVTLLQTARVDIYASR
jgi:hypothetical protein